MIINTILEILEIIHSPSARSACTHHWSPIAHLRFHQCSNTMYWTFAQCSFSIPSTLSHCLCTHCSSQKIECFRDWIRLSELHVCILNYYWMNVLIPGLSVCGIFFENQSLQADDIVKKVSKYPLQNQVKTFMIIQISVSRIFIHQ